MRVVKIGCAILAICALFLLTGCGAFIPAEELQQEAVTAAIIRPTEIKAAATPTPEPIIEKREPVKSHSAMRIQQDAPEASLQSYYTPIDLEGINHSVYAFTDTEGITKYRVWAEVDELEDENVMNTLVGFFNAEVYMTENGFFVQTNKDENPINVSEDKICKIKPCPPPIYNNVQSYIRNMENAARQYEREKEKAEKNGEPLPEPTPWDGLPIYTRETEILKLPNRVKLVSRKDNALFYYENVFAEKEYYKYGTPNGTDSGFYVSNEDGKIRAGSLIVDISQQFVPDNFRKYPVQEKPEDYIRRVPVIIRLSSGDLQTVYAIYPN